MQPTCVSDHAMTRPHMQRFSLVSVISTWKQPYYPRILAKFHTLGWKKTTRMLHPSDDAGIARLTSPVASKAIMPFLSRHLDLALCDDPLSLFG